MRVLDLFGLAASGLMGFTGATAIQQISNPSASPLQTSFTALASVAMAYTAWKIYRNSSESDNSKTSRPAMRRHIN